MLGVDCPALQDNRSDKTPQCKVSLKRFRGYTSLPETLNRNFVCYEIRLYENTYLFIIHFKYIDVSLSEALRTIGDFYGKEVVIEERIFLKIFNSFIRILFFESTLILLPNFQNKLKYHRS